MQQEYTLGKVVDVLQETSLYGEGSFYSQQLKIQSSDGALYTVTYGDQYQPISEVQKKSVGDRVILTQQASDMTEPQMIISDAYRLPTVAWMTILFAMVVIFVGKFKGLLSLVGMFLSFVILVGFVIPQILHGANPIVVSLFGSFLIGSVTVYISHGYTSKSHIAIFSMMASLFTVAIISYIAVKTAGLFGLGSEEAYFLQVGETASLNLQGLLLGGIMLGALGVLDDVTVSQVSIVFQLRAAKRKIGFSELYSRSIEVGRDHVASLVNTLVLAYAGANMPLFLLFTLSDTVPTWVALNSELLVEEIVRTISGSIGLVLAVPLTTLVSTWYALRLSDKQIDALDHSTHVH